MLRLYAHPGIPNPGPPKFPFLVPTGPLLYWERSHNVLL